MLKQGYTSNVKTIDIWLEADNTAPVPIRWDGGDYAYDFSKSYETKPSYFSKPEKA
jgi:hypothetical protein